MSEPDKIILSTSPEAASLQTVTGWVSRTGIFYGNDERIARFAGCTHVPCDACGKVTEKLWTHCEECRKTREIARYEAMPRKPWDGQAMLYSEAWDEYFDDPGAAEEALDEGQTLADLRLVICEPNYGRPLDDDYFCDELGEDGHLPVILESAIETFNEALAKAPALSWSPGKYALELLALPLKPDHA